MMRYVVQKGYTLAEKRVGRWRLFRFKEFPGQEIPSFDHVLKDFKLPIVLNYEGPSADDIVSSHSYTTEIPGVFSYENSRTNS
jgi:hypothetical protein